MSAGDSCSFVLALASVRALGAVDVFSGEHRTPSFSDLISVFGWRGVEVDFVRNREDANGKLLLNGLLISSGYMTTTGNISVLKFFVCALTI